MNKNSVNRKRVIKETQPISQPKKHKKPDKKIVKQKKKPTSKTNEFSKKLLALNKENDNGEVIDEVKSSDEEIQLDIEDLKQDDPFRLQYDYELSPDLLTVLSKKPLPWILTSLKWPQLGNLRFFQAEAPNDKKDSNQTPSIIDKTNYASPRNMFKVENEFNLENLHVKSQIIKNVTFANQKFLNQDLTEFQKELFKITCNYQDLYYSERTYNNSEEIRMVYCTHAVNHALKTRMKITRNNYKLTKGKESDFRDHGLVRPKVLILVPFRDSALRVVKMIMAILLGDGGNIMNKRRFLESYSGETLRMPQKNPKPTDYEQTFYGNTDDNFKIGLALTKKSFKLYVDFYQSDIIVASPLGIRMLIGAEGESERDYDFLSSIELLILDQAEVFLMQNWEHMLHIISHMHLVPKDSHGTDLTRVRMWALNGWSKYYIQNMIFSSHPLPEISALFNMISKNFSGRVIVNNPVTNGSIQQIIVPFPQLFHEISASSVMNAVDARFEMFVTKFLPQFTDPLMKHTLIYVPSYFDYVKIRNHFKKQDISFVQICEYSKDGKIARARDLFYHGEVHFMLYSERFHFFRRIRVKGIRHLLFYQPPAFPHFYSEMCNLMKDIKAGKDNMGQSDLSVTVLYTRYDVSQLATIVGTDRATRMLASDKSVHMFMTDS